MILTAEFRFNGGYEIRRVATDFWYSLPTDALGVQEFAGRITKVPSYKIEVGCAIWASRTNISIGSIEVVNTDYGVTEWLSLKARDCECILKLVNAGDSYDSAQTVAVCIIDSVEMDENVIRVNLRGKDTLLDKPLQPISYTATQALEAATIEGNPLPIAMGSLWQIEPVLVDVNSLRYDIGDSYYKEIFEVLSGGSTASPPSESPDDYFLTSTGFQMLVTPSARITVNMVGNRLPSLYQENDFSINSGWSGSNPSGWTVVSGGGSISRAANIGAVFTNAQSFDGEPEMYISGSVGIWYFVVINIVNIESGGVAVTVGQNTVEYRREGRYCTIGTIETEVDNIKISALGYTELTIAYVHVYEMVESVDVLQVSQCIKNICIRSGMRVEGDPVDAEVATTSLYQAGLFSKAAISCREALQMILDSIGGWTYTGTDGVIQFGKLRLAVGPHVLTVSKNNLLSYPVYKPDLADGLSTRVAGGKNWSPYGDAELAGITYPNRPPFMVENRYIRTGVDAENLAKPYSHAVTAEPIKTLIYDGLSTQAEADRITGIYSAERGFWEFTIALESASDVSIIQPDAIVLLDGDFFGTDNGKIARVVAIDGEYNDPKMKITVWGASSV